MSRKLLALAIANLTSSVNSIESSSVWLGSQQAYDTVANLGSVLASGEIHSRYSDEDMGFADRNYEITGDGTAVLELKGSFINASLPPFIERLFGVRGYASMQRDFEALAQDPEVKRVILDVDSGGGATSGIYDTIQALTDLRAVKSVATYSSNFMCSAAYWIGSSVDMVGTSPMCASGNIGAMLIHTEHSGSLQQHGVKATIIRSRPNKGLGTSVEPLSPEARVELESHVNFIHDKFVEQVSANRRISVETLESGISDGKVFFAQDAKKNGLIDIVGSFDEFVSQFEAADVRSNATSGSIPLNTTLGAGNMDLTQALAKIAEMETEAANQTAKVAQLDAELKTSRSAQAVMAEKVESLEAQISGHGEVEAKFKSNLEASITSMAIALNAEAVIPTDLAGVEAYHAAMTTRFQEKFPKGQVSATGGEDKGTEATLPSWYSTAFPQN